MEEKVFYFGEIGRPIGLKTGVDWTGATSKQVIIYRPDGTKLTYTGDDVVVDDATLGIIHVLSKNGDFNQTGQYLAQAKVVTATVTLFGPLTSFIVEGVLA